MAVLYIDCGMGASGDMLLGALLALQDDLSGALAALNAMDVRLRFEANSGESGTLAGMRVRVLAGGHEEGEHHAEGHGVTLKEIYVQIDALHVSADVRTHAKAVYALLAAAESAAHGSTSHAVHFHELGMLDAIGDIAGCCLLLDRIGAQRIVASPVHVGSGAVKCAHGLLQVPAPATANLLLGIPIYGGDVEGELCTPTGAALLRHFAKEFSAMPSMCVQKIGYGLGKKNFLRPNVLRAFLGVEETGGVATNDLGVEISCNLDDMTGEQMGFALERLMATGARDVCYMPIIMKKGRPAYRLLCQCAPADAEAIVQAVFQHTTTFGVQRIDTQRYILNRKTITRESSLGSFRVKTGTGFGVSKEKAEYADIAEAAEKHDLSFAAVLQTLGEDGQK